ncbi:MAG: ATP-binding cassette domain-containing protein [Cyanobacteria bacterium P01_A01_bin.84]
MGTTDKPKLKVEQVSLYGSLSSQGKVNQLGYPILQDISFEVFPGEKIAIVGITGAGKTSLLRLLNRLDEPSSGNIYWYDKKYCHIDVSKLRSNVTLLGQESKLLGMNVKQALSYPLILRGVSQQIIEQKIREYTEKLHIPFDWMQRTELQLSMGQKQLVAIARALMIQPEILLLDEPTSALDGENAELVGKVLLEMSETHKTTILMTNHQLIMAQKFCTRLLYLQQGRLLLNQSNLEVDWANLEEKLHQAEAEDEFGL